MSQQRGGGDKLGFFERKGRNNMIFGTDMYLGPLGGGKGSLNYLPYSRERDLRPGGPCPPPCPAQSAAARQSC